jgi:hypothetical protein
MGEQCWYALTSKLPEAAALGACTHILHDAVSISSYVQCKFKQSFQQELLTLQSAACCHLPALSAGGAQAQSAGAGHGQCGTVVEYLKAHTLSPHNKTAPSLFTHFLCAQMPVGAHYGRSRAHQGQVPLLQRRTLLARTLRLILRSLAAAARAAGVVQCSWRLDGGGEGGGHAVRAAAAQPC